MPPELPADPDDLDALFEVASNMLGAAAPFEGLTAEGLAALNRDLSRSLSTLQVPEQGAGKLLTAGLVAMVAVLVERTGGLPSAARDPLRARLAQENGWAQPLLRTLVGDLLAAAGVSALPDAPQDAEHLRSALAGLLGARPSLSSGGWPAALGAEDVPLYVAGLSFCRGAEAWTNLQAGHTAFARIHPEGGSSLDAVERAAFAEALRTYIDDSETTVFQYGLWEGEAKRAAGAVRNREATAPWLGEAGTLAADPPRLGNVPLTPAQAAWFAANLDLVRDDLAARRFLEGLTWARDLLPGRSPLPPTSFHLFTRVHDVLRNRAEASEDGRLDYADLKAELLEVAGTLHGRLPALLDQLRSAEPRWGHVGLGPEGAAAMAELAATRVRSDRALDNLEEALAAWATGSIGGGEAGPVALDDEAFAGFDAFLQAYLGTWPQLQVFDFNKLGRMALAEASGDPVPLCRINGEARDPGTFHVAVGEAVMAAIPAGRLAQPWMARRFGYRAKQCIELVDLLAEQQSRGRGPLPGLFGEVEDTRVRVVATTTDLFYNLLVFGLEQPGRAVKWLYLDSTGALVERREPEAKHRLFEALLDRQGHLDVQVAKELSLSPRAYPLQNPYGLGDRVDIELYDSDAAENQTEKERFETRYKVVHGTIVAYDAHGQHRVAWTTPEGEVVEKELGYEALRTQNNPHYVDEEDGEECSTRMRRSRDERLAADLEAMTAIARSTGLLEFPLELDENALARRQKRFLAELNAFTSSTMHYPRKPAVDDKDHRYWDHLNLGTHPAGDYLECERGVCRHMFIREHMGKQRGGIDERFASGAANTYGGDFRGLHIWGEVSLADKARLGHDNPEPRDTRYLSDATWKDPYVPLWDGAYGNDARRIEMYNRTSYRAHLVVRS